MHESIIRVLPPPNCIAHIIIIILLHDQCAMYEPPPTSLFAIHHTMLVMTISCKDQHILTLDPD